MPENENIDLNGYKMAMEVFIEGQKENTRAIRSIESNMSKLANLVTELAGGRNQIERTVNALHDDIHKDGGLFDRMIIVESNQKVESKNKQLIGRIATPVLAFISAWVLAILTGK